MKNKLYIQVKMEKEREIGLLILIKMIILWKEFVKLQQNKKEK